MTDEAQLDSRMAHATKLNTMEVVPPAAVCLTSFRPQIIKDPPEHQTTLPHLIQSSHGTAAGALSGMYQHGQTGVRGRLSLQSLVECVRTAEASASSTGDTLFTVSHASLSKTLERVGNWPSVWKGVH